LRVGQDVTDPGFALVPDHGKVPRAGGEVVRGCVPKPRRFLLAGEPRVVVRELQNVRERIVTWLVSRDGIRWKMQVDTAP
jgi:hypothetical protein